MVVVSTNSLQNEVISIDENEYGSYGTHDMKFNHVKSERYDGDEDDAAAKNLLWYASLAHVAAYFFVWQAMVAIGSASLQRWRAKAL
mmetsp:Transcript_21016/g.51658  ORF Transcript_21016/g.51658 Transcript_21016/m.51658 type:complete len:87 (-) Transcript_21016:229-489(-)